MQRRIGPILHLRNGPSSDWNFSVGIWVDGGGATPALHFDTAAKALISAPTTVKPAFAGASWLYWNVRIPRRSKEFRTDYRISGLGGGPIAVGDVVVPAIDQAPRIAFFSCNGVQDSKDWTTQPEMEALWVKMKKRHQRGVQKDGSGGPYHVMLGGGDQIYCDSVWKDVAKLAAFGSWDARRKFKNVTPALAKDIETHYGALYDRWRESSFGEMMACVPGLYTWDDHDIFDGYGSYDDRLQGCDLFDAIFKQARRAFELFQIGGGPAAADSACVDPTGAHYLQYVSIGDSLDVLLLDLRTQRTATRVMNDSQWAALKQVLADRAKNAKPASQLLVVSSIPVVYLNFGAAEKLLDWFPWRQDLEDDLRDQWESKDHQEERARLVTALLDHSVATHTRITIVSGDVHVGSRGRIVSTRPKHLLDAESEATIHQLTSSAIVYPAPNGLTLAGMRAVSGEGPAPILAVSNVHTELLPVGVGEFLLGERNWLSIEPKEVEPSRQELWVRWITEDRDVKPPLVVRPR